MPRVVLSNREVKNRTSGALSLLTIFVILLIIGGVVAAGYFFITYEAPEVVKSTANGDTVKVDYTGMFEDGRVFDTSRLDIARDNATYPKSLSFKFRTTGYTPLEFTVGAGQMIAGFDEGVLGMKKGDQKSITVLPEKGYGSPDPSLIEVRQLIEELPVKEEMNVSQFGDRFNRVAEEGKTEMDPFWKWDVYVLHITGDLVTIQHQPEVGMVISPYTVWSSMVIYIDSGANEGKGVIKVEHLLEKSDENNIKSTEERGDFIITEVNLEEGTYTVDFNREVVGQTLIFHITMVEIIKPE